MTFPTSIGVPTSMASRRTQIGFAHRGGPDSISGANTLQAFTRALANGASGLESDVWLTADDVPVLHHPRLPWQGLRIRKTRFADLPRGIVSLQRLYEECGTNFELALDMPTPAAAPHVIEVASAVSADNKLWLTFWKLETMKEWKRRWPQVRLVVPSLGIPGRGPMRSIVSLENAGIDVLNLHHFGVTARAVRDAHDHGLGVFAWGVNRKRSLDRVLSAGVDGVFSDDVPAMMVAVKRHQNL